MKPDFAWAEFLIARRAMIVNDLSQIMGTATFSTRVAAVIPCLRLATIQLARRFPLTPSYR